MSGKLVHTLFQSINRNEPVALVVITGKEGSSPRGIGSMMVVDQKGNLLKGSIGGGALEEKVKTIVPDYIKRNISGTISYTLGKESYGPAHLDMLCGGSVEVFIKVFNPSEQIIIAGCGHIAQALYQFATIMGYHITIVDSRKEMMREDLFPGAKLLTGEIPSILQEYPINENTSIVIVTHGHHHDEASLESVIHSPARYIGMIGSTKKINACFDNLVKKGIDRLTLEKVHAPIGLDLGGEQPIEIALAILSQIQAIKYGREGGMLCLK